MFLNIIKSIYTPTGKIIISIILGFGFASLFKNEVAKAVQQQQIQDRDTGFYYKEQEYVEDSELYKRRSSIV